MEKKPAEPKLSPGEMVSREANRVEQEIMVDLLETAVRNHLQMPFQMDSKIWFEPAMMAYCVKIRIAGKDEKGKTYSLVFTGRIPEEDIILHASDTVSWRRYMELTTRAWVERMTRDLHEKGATRLLVGGRKKSYLDLKGDMDDLAKKIDAFSAATKKMSQAWSVPSEKLYALGNQYPKNYRTWVEDTSASLPLSLEEARELKESLRLSAERRRTS